VGLVFLFNEFNLRRKEIKNCCPGECGMPFKESSAVVAQEGSAVLMNCHSTEEWASAIRTFVVRVALSSGALELLHNTGGRFTI